MSRIKLDLHSIYNKGEIIEAQLNNIIIKAKQKKIDYVEIIPGKGSGQLKKRVLRFLNRSDIKILYHRLKVDTKNFGKLYIYFKK